MKLLVWFKDLFIPHPRNNHKAKLLHPASLSVVVAFFLVSQFSLNFFTLTSPSVLGFASDIKPEQVIELTNQKRLESGLEPLELDETLNEVAQKKAGDMFAFDYWAHISPSGRDPWSFFQEAGYKYIYAGENLARDFMNSESVVGAWMNSPTHKDNILNSKYKETGLAVVNGTLNGVETTLVVQVFGTPTPAPSQTALFSRPRLGEASAAALATSQESQPKLSPFSLTKTAAVFLLGLIFGALVVDAFLVSRKKIIRLSGKNLAHLIFMGFLLLAVILTSQGAIL